MRRFLSFLCLLVPVIGLVIATGIEFGEWVGILHLGNPYGLSNTFMLMVVAPAALFGFISLKTNIGIFERKGFSLITLLLTVVASVEFLYGALTLMSTLVYHLYSVL